MDLMSVHPVGVRPRDFLHSMEPSVNAVKTLRSGSEILGYLHFTAYEWASHWNDNAGMSERRRAVSTAHRIPASSARTIACADGMHRVDL